MDSRTPRPQPIRSHRPQHPGRERNPERTIRTCPVCGSELAERKCKLYCPDPVCGYFVSCAEFH
jgi:hypothetical protein